jgi:hypothetical protein
MRIYDDDDDDDDHNDDDGDDKKPIKKDLFVVVRSYDMDESTI